MKIENKLHISTGIIESTDNTSINKRIALLEDVIDVVVKQNTDILILPAGYFSTNKRVNRTLPHLVKSIVKYIGNSNLYICFGLDARDPIDQLAVAINRNGMVALGRKFYPTDMEYIDKANDYLCSESGLERIFKVKNRSIYLAVCYDSFGIRKQKLVNPGVDLIFNLIHGFNPAGEGNSGEVYFAKYGLAGSSKQWGCPTFGSAVFWNRYIPQNWPSGVLWNGNCEHELKYWKYEENNIKPISEVKIFKEKESVLLRNFDLL